VRKTQRVTQQLCSSSGATIAVIMELNFEIATAISAGFAILYTVVGGLYSVTYTDMAQLIFIVFGLVSVHTVVAVGRLTAHFNFRS
jgi:Na+/proline symporter